MKEKLYDIRKRDYPHERGAVFRSLQVSECWVCGSKNNRIVMGGYPGYGVRSVCPNSSEEWHHELEDKMVWLSDHPHPKSYKDELQKEIDEMTEEHKDKIKNDIVGEPDFKLKRWATNTKSYKPGQGIDK